MCWAGRSRAEIRGRWREGRRTGKEVKSFNWERKWTNPIFTSLPSLCHGIGKAENGHRLLLDAKQSFHGNETKAPYYAAVCYYLRHVCNLPGKFSLENPLDLTRETHVKQQETSATKAMEKLCTPTVQVTQRGHSGSTLAGAAARLAVSTQCLSSWELKEKWK